MQQRETVTGQEGVEGVEGAGRAVGGDEAAVGGAEEGRSRSTGLVVRRAVAAATRLNAQ